MHCAGFKPTSRPVATNIMKKHSTALRGVVGVAAAAVSFVPPISYIESRPGVKITIISSNSNNISLVRLPPIRGYGGTRKIYYNILSSNF